MGSRHCEIARQGYGHVYIKYAFNQMEWFRHYERQARTSGRGFWCKVQTIRPKTAEATPNMKGKLGQVVVYRTTYGKIMIRVRAGRCGRASIGYS